MPPTIKPLKSQTTQPEHPCPKCGAAMSLDSTAGVFRCRTCAYKQDAPRESLDEAMARIRAKGARPPVPITHRGEVDPRVRSVFETAHDALWREDAAEALRGFRRCIELQPDFADAHLWLAKLSDDEAVKRDHLGEIIANDPGHAEALRLLMVLNGRLTQAQAERAATHSEPILMRADAPVEAKTKLLLCPVCGGHLTVDEADNRVECRFCGHTAALDKTGHSAYEGADLLSMALMERRAKGGRWLVGARLLHCNQCGAERTLPGERMSLVCPFCGSNQVIEQDALGSIEPPDGLIPFRVSEEQAKAAVREKLKGVGERFVGLFEDNRVQAAVIEALFIPFWVFDALVEVNKTVVDKRTAPADGRNLRAYQNRYQQIKFMDGLNSIRISALTSVPLAGQIGAFDLSAMTAYEPKLLARYPAALYDLDVDKASLEARSVISAHMRGKHIEAHDRDIEITLFSSPVQMSFVLVLMPVWVATLYERDGDIRPALVNGQTGQAALGKARPGR